MSADKNEKNELTRKQKTNIARGVSAVIIIGATVGGVSLYKNAQIIFSYKGTLQDSTNVVYEEKANRNKLELTYISGLKEIYIEDGGQKNSIMREDAPTAQEGPRINFDSTGKIKSIDETVEDDTANVNNSDLVDKFESHYGNHPIIKRGNEVKSNKYINKKFRDTRNFIKTRIEYHRKTNMRLQRF